MNERIHGHIKTLIRAGLLTLVIMFSYLVGYLTSSMLQLPYDDISGMWCAVTAVVVFDDLPAAARALVKDRLLGTLFGTVIAAVSIVLTHHAMLSIAIALFSVIAFIIFFNMNGAVKIACATVLIIGITSFSYKYTDEEIWIFAGMRFFESVIGGSISLLATISLYKINNRLNIY